MLVVTCIAISGATSHGASTGSTTVGATVLAATELDVTGCAGTDLALGTVAGLATTISSTDCTVTFGSTNAASSLRMVQSDERGSALTQWASAGTSRRAAPRYRGVGAKSATEAWAVGQPGRPGDPTPISYTSDGGASWASQTSCVAGANLYEAAWVTGTTVMAVGSPSVLCRSTNNGTTWTQVTAPASSSWLTVDFLNASDGWTAGTLGRVARTSDGGATWSNLPVPDANWNFNRLRAASATRLYGVVSDFSTTPVTVRAVTSADAGATWSSVALGNSFAGGFASGVAVTGPASAIVTSYYGTHRTTDSGATWTLVDPGARLCATALDSSTIITYYAGGANPAPRRSTDGGATWASLPLVPGTVTQLWGCDSGSATSVFAAGYNDIRAASSDSGVTHVASASSYRNLFGISSWTSDRFVAVGATGAVRRSVDGGATITFPTSGTASDLMDVEAFGDATEIAVAVGLSGTIVRSVDGGATWSSVASGTAQGLFNVDRADDGTLVVVGDSGVVLRSLDDGVSWQSITPPAAILMRGVSVLSRNDIWVTGSGGAIYRTTNGGASWASQASGTTLELVAIDTIDGQNAIAVSYVNGALQAVIARTVDGGANWTTTTTATGVYTYDVQYLNATTLVIGSSNGYLRSTDAGATWAVIGNGFVNSYAVAEADGNTFAVAGQSDFVGTIAPTQVVPDYVFGSVDFSGAAGAFGTCLHTQSGTTATTWSPAGAGNCTAANLAVWHGIPSSVLAAEVASRASSGTGTLAFRFGFKPSAAQRAGDYAADVRFEVVSP